MKETIVPYESIAELTPDNRNANRGTERGQAALEDSLRRYGVGRSILVDRNGKIIAGNKTVEQAGQIGIDTVIVVRTRGREIVAVMREDLDLDTDPEARALAIADNRVAELDLSWDAMQVLQDVGTIGNLEPFFYQNEIDDLVERASQAASEAANNAGEKGDTGNESEQSGKGESTIQFNIIFGSEAERAVWESYLQFLRKHYPHYETHGERIVTDVAARMEEKKI